MSQTALFDETDLTDWLHKPVSAEAATIAERVAWGWLRPLINLDERPDVPSDELLAWAIELGGIAHCNPEGLVRYALDQELSIYSSERRDEILRMAADGGTVAPGSAPKPMGVFPHARRYPDPARSSTGLEHL